MRLDLSKWTPIGPTKPPGGAPSGGGSDGPGGGGSPTVTTEAKPTAPPEPAPTTDAPTTDAPSVPEAPPKPKLNARYKLTKEQDKAFRDRLKAAEGDPALQEQIRFERKQQGLANEGKEPFDDIDDWRGFVGARKLDYVRGSTSKADLVRPHLAKYLNKKLASGDSPKKYDIDIPNALEGEPKVARPDSTAVNDLGKPDPSVIHDHKHMGGGKGKQVLRDSTQLQAERQHAHDANGTHVISMSSERPNLEPLNNALPEPRPHPDIVNAGSMVVYADPVTGQITHVWRNGRWERVQ